MPTKKGIEMVINNGNKYIHFELKSDTGKTQRWLVRTNYQSCLGEICWYSGWRQYVFQPVGYTEYNNGCLQSITDFITRLNKEKRILEKFGVEV